MVRVTRIRFNDLADVIERKIDCIDEIFKNKKLQYRLQGADIERSPSVK
jgi:hypothetical protein